MQKKVAFDELITTMYTGLQYIQDGRYCTNIYFGIL